LVRKAKSGTALIAIASLVVEVGDIGIANNNTRNKIRV
jgi:hypothetical protein